MKKTIIILSAIIGIGASSCSKTTVDQPFPSKYYTVTGTVSATTGTGTGSVTLNINDDNFAFPQAYGAALNATVSWSGLSATAGTVDSIAIKGLDQSGANVSILLGSKILNSATGTLNVTNFMLPVAQKTVLLKGTWQFFIYGKGNNVLTATLNQITSK
jgi:hypothetical protein